MPPSTELFFMKPQNRREQKCILLMMKNVSELQLKTSKKYNIWDAITKKQTHKFFCMPSQSNDASQSKDTVAITFEGTDVFWIAISKADITGVSIYMKRDTQNRTRFVDITDISTNLGIDLSQSIPGIHALTGCDSVSAFAGKRKVAALQVLCKHPSFQKAFIMFGEEIDVKYRSH